MWINVLYNLWDKQAAERLPYNQQETSGDWQGQHFDFNVGDLLTKAKNIKVRQLALGKIDKELDWWDKDEAHAKATNTKYPLLAIKMPDGELTIADGLNRLWKMKNVEHRKTMPARVLNFKDLMQKV